ncbi:MAG: hypothetical protein AAF985_00055 [Bacteroidota bacterium]
MIQLAIFCPECTPWLLLMLAGAWVLGGLFWALLKGTGYQSQIKSLSTELDQAHTENTNLKTAITQARYEVEKREGEFTKLKLKLGDLDLKYKVRGEELDAAIAKAQGLPTELNEKIAALEKELAQYKNDGPT